MEWVLRVTAFAQQAHSAEMKVGSMFGWSVEESVGTPTCYYGGTAHNVCGFLPLYNSLPDTKKW